MSARVVRLCVALWLFAFLAGASYAMGPRAEGARLAQAQTGP